MKFNLVIKLQRERCNFAHQLKVNSTVFKHTINMNNHRTQLKALQEFPNSNTQKLNCRHNHLDAYFGTSKMNYTYLQGRVLLPNPTKFWPSHLSTSMNQHHLLYAA